MTNETTIAKQKQRAKRYDLPGLAEQVAYIVDVPDRPELRTIFGEMPEALAYAKAAHENGAPVVLIAAEYSARFDVLTMGGRAQ